MITFEPFEKERIALGYEAAEDDISFIHDYDIHAMRQLINAQFTEISKIIYFDFVDTDPHPYVSIKEFEADFRNKTIKVNTSGNDSELWGKMYNLQFRAIHDWIHCVHGLDFSYGQEIRAYNKQIEFSLKFGNQFNYLNWELYKKVLRSEIVYQGAFKEHFKVFHLDQKIILQDL